MIPVVPGDVRGTLREREFRHGRSRVFLWFAASLLLLGLPSATVLLFVPGWWP